MTSARPIAVIRDHNRIIVYIGRTGVSRLARLELKLFASAPTVAAGTGINGSGSAWRAIVRGKPTDRASLSINASKLTCAQLERSRVELAGVLSSGVGPELRGQEQAERILRAAPAPAGNGSAVPTVGPYSLASALRLTARTSRRSAQDSTTSRSSIPTARRYWSPTTTQARRSRSPFDRTAAASPTRSRRTR